jgi:hypothetical protein
LRTRGPSTVRRHPEPVSDDDDQLLQQYLSDVRAVPDLGRETLGDLLARARDGEAEAEARVLEALLEVTAVLTQHLAPPTMRTLDAIQEANLVLMSLVRDRDVQVPVLGTKIPGVKRQPLRLGLRWVVEATKTWWSNYGQLRRNTDRRARHRHAALCRATAILIVGRLIDWRNRYSTT